MLKKVHKNVKGRICNTIYRGSKDETMFDIFLNDFYKFLLQITIIPANMSQTVRKWHYEYKKCSPKKLLPL